VLVTEVKTSAGQPATLCIEVKGHPPPVVEWFKDNIPVEHSTLSDGSLYIANAQTHDSGNYSVKLTNTSGYCEESIIVEVSQPVPPEGTYTLTAVLGSLFFQSISILMFK